MKKIFAVLAILAVIGGCIGYYMYNKPADKMESLKVDESLSAEQLFASYEADEMAANKRFLDKIIVVKGKVAKTKKDEEKATILLDTGDILANIMCQMENIEGNLPAEGSIVSIKGLCTGYLTDVVLIKGIIYQQ